MARSKARVGRNWDGVIWPDSVPLADLAAVFRRYHVEGCISPLHDRDTYFREDVDEWKVRHMGSDGVLAPGLDVPEVGDSKKPHYHFMLCFSGNKSELQVRDLLTTLDGNYRLERTEDKRKMLRYMIHLDDKEKAQYDANDLLTFGGLDLSPLYTMDDVQTVDAVAELFELITANDITYFCDFADYVMTSGDYALAQIVLKRSSLFQSYIQSYGTKLADDRLGKDYGRD